MGFCIGLSDTWQLSFQQPVSEELFQELFLVQTGGCSDVAKIKAHVSVSGICG